MQENPSMENKNWIARKALLYKNNAKKPDMHLFENPTLDYHTAPLLGMELRVWWEEAHMADAVLESIT